MSDTLILTLNYSYIKGARQQGRTGGGAGPGPP